MRLAQREDTPVLLKLIRELAAFEHLEDLYVQPHARGRGAGTWLIRFVAKIAVERQCGRFEWSVLKWNTRAVDFYRALGAVAMDEWTVQRVTGEALARLGGYAFPAAD